MSLALARKYRPSTFDDLIGQEAVSQTLSLALDSSRLSHAYLFSGLRGSGKTSTARIFAKALLCQKGSTAHPCGQCIHCEMASQNRHMDIIEMDAASSRGIDDIKELIEHTKYKPSSARYKIFIIDEVHMLTNQAFNALLKTLEEPPDFVKFILATTDPLKLPATILSRTQHFRFKKIPQNLVLKHLEHILNLESIEYESAAIDILARSGAGSLRDSLTLLDQAIVYSKNFVDVNTVTSMLGIIEPSILEGLLQSILHKNSHEVLAFIKLAANYEAEMILDELTLYLKELLLSHNTTFTPMIIERFFRVIAESKNLLSLGSDGEFVLALTLFKMLEALSIKEIDTMIQELEQELKGIEVSPKITPATPLPTSEVLTIQNNPSSPSGIEKVRIEEPTNTIMPMTSQHSKETTIEPKKAVSTASYSSTQQAQNRKEETVQNNITVNPYQKTFDTLLSKIYDRNYELGQCFERNITFESFKEGKLTWISTAQDSDKKELITHWGIINMFVKELFGIETKIANISKKKRSDSTSVISENKENSNSSESPNSQNFSTQNSNNYSLQDTTPQCTLPSHQDADSSSMIEALEMKSSCIAPDAGETEAAKEKDPATLLDEPMVKEAIALFDPKKVRVKRNS